MGYMHTGRQIFVRLPDELVSRLEQYVNMLADQQPGLNPTRSDAIRILLTKALDAEMPRVSL